MAEGNAVSAVETMPDGTTAFANNSLWWVRLDEPETAADETSDLEIGFSTALLEKADWYSDDGNPVKFRFDAVHVLRDGSPQEAHVTGAHFFAFDQRETDTPEEKARWSNVETNGASVVEMQTGEYRPLQFAFTKPGVYLVQVQAEGHVRNTFDPEPEEGLPEGWEQISSDLTITSPAQWYTFHVGEEDDVSASIQPVDADGEPVSTIDSADEEVRFKVSASNAGLDATADALVQVHLPRGLTYNGLPDLGDDVDNPAEGTSVSDHCDGAIVTWQLNSLAAATHAAMTFTATVDDGAPGNLSATAEIRNLDSRVLDTESSNNLDRTTLVREGAPASTPSFGFWNLSILEHAIPGSHAGDPVRVSNEDGRELSYQLSGPCSDKFTVHSNGQIVLADGAGLNYEEQWAFPLILEVSDGVDSLGADDSTWTADDSTEVLIEVIGTDQGAEDHPTVTFWLTSDGTVLDPLDVVAGQPMLIHTRLDNVPDSLNPGGWEWQEEGKFVPNWWDRVHGSTYPAYVEASEVPPGETLDVEYTVHIKWEGGGVTAAFTITWNAPSS